MGKTKKEKGIQNGDDMPLDKKSDEDFNNQHPDHDQNGLINADASSKERDKGNDNKQTSDMKTPTTKSENKETTKTLKHTSALCILR